MEASVQKFEYANIEKSDSQCLQIQINLSSVGIFCRNLDCSASQLMALDIYPTCGIYEINLTIEVPVMTLDFYLIIAPNSKIKLAKLKESKGSLLADN